MKYAWYMFRVDEPITHCYYCPCHNSEYGSCQITENLIELSCEPKNNNCPLIKIEGRVEE